MKKRFFIQTLGCPKNEADSDHLIGLLEKEGFKHTPKPSDADFLILNSCGFIESAKKESIDAILELAKKKAGSKEKKLVLAGCLSQRYGAELAKEIPEIDLVVGTHNLLGLAKKLKEDGGEGQVVEVFDSWDSSLLRPARTLPKLGYAYLKIADGCSSNCSYCAIPLIKGPYKSRSIESVMSEAEFLIDNGVKEVILVAQDLALYGLDSLGRLALVDLLSQLINLKGEYRIRLLYLQPHNLTDEILDVMASSDKICKYLDLPFQHGSMKILKAMNRPGSINENLGIIERARERLDEVAIRSSFIIGFPGETEADFDQLVEFIETAKFDHAGFFEYSSEEGTGAALLKRKVPKRVIKERHQKLSLLQDEISFTLNERHVGRTAEVLIGKDYFEGAYWGTARHQAPEIDTLVKIPAKKGNLEANKFIKVKIVKSLGHDLLGRIT